MSISNSIDESNFGWNIQLYTKDGNGNYLQSTDYSKSAVQTITHTQGKGSGWVFGNQEYRYNDTFRFVNANNDQGNDLTKYNIFITQKMSYPDSDNALSKRF